jgi:hypothetical protein
MYEPIATKSACAGGAGHHGRDPAGHAHRGGRPRCVFLLCVWFLVECVGHHAFRH